MKRLLPVMATLILLLAACSGVNAGGPQPAAAAPSPAASGPAAAPSGNAAATDAPSAAENITATPAGQAAPAAVAAAPAAASNSSPAVAAMATAAATANVPATTAPNGGMPAATAASAPVPALTQAAAAPVCTPGALTQGQTEGPYYKANPPEDSDLVQPGMAGTKLTITGYVLDASCKPIAGARVDFWQADAAGNYDNSGYTLRGYQLTDAQGRYTVETVVPGLYPGRTRHIHVKVTPPNGQTLTTQLYFPDEAANSRDQIFAAQNVLKIQKTADGEVGTFDFVVKR